MRLSGEEYSKRLRGFSRDTIRLISDLNASTKEKALKKIDITTDSTLTEEEIVQKLKEILASE